MVGEPAAKHNPNDIATSAIAKRMGLNQGAPFRHFATRDAILQAAMKQVTERHLLSRFDKAALDLASPMADDNMNRFEQEHLKRWWKTTRHYLFADMESLSGAAFEAYDGWAPPQPDSNGGRKRFLARVRGRLLRSVEREGKDDPLRELESVFQQQIMFIARHPDVPRRLWSWLAQDDGDPGLQRRVRMLIAYYASRLARIIARAKQQGLVGVNIKPDAAAIALVGVVQELVLRTHAAPPTRDRFMREAAKAWTLYRAALTGSFRAERAL